jgi:hypothetical protein
MESINAHDRTILRDLASRVRQIAADPIMERRKALWKKHNRLQKARPMILIFPEGSWIELLPDSTLTCEGKDARRIEGSLRSRIYTYEHFQDDTVCVAEWVVGAVTRNTGWGLWAHWKHSDDPRGAKGMVPCLNTFDDFKKMHHPELSYDEAATKADFAAAQDLFGGILDVKLKGIAHHSYHLTSLVSQLRGLDQMMLDMLDNPGFLHDIMQFLVEGHTKVRRQIEQFNLFSLNNDNTYHSSGGVGWTDELPGGGSDPSRVRPKDMWASAEAQELALVSPDHHDEFCLRYEKQLLAPFGLIGYGCCEDLSRKLDLVLSIPNIRRISISPFADVERSAARLGNKAIFSWKPHPAHLVGNFDEKAIRAYIDHTLDVCAAHGCVLEMILKDTHTCEHRPERFDNWTRIARQAVEEQ